MYGNYILHELHRFPWEWIDRPYHDKMVVFAMIDNKVKEDKRQHDKMKAQQKSTPKGGRGRTPRRRRR